MRHGDINIWTDKDYTDSAAHHSQKEPSDKRNFQNKDI